MRFFTNKTFLFKLIATLCLILLVVNFGMSTVSQAKSTAAAIGGKLLSPVVDLLLGIGDGILNIIQKAIMGTEAAITIDTGLKLVYVLISALLIGLATVAAWPIITAISGITLLAGAVGILQVGGFLFAYQAISGAFLPEITLLPTYSISPEELFQGHILLFDVNIFNPKEVYVQVVEASSNETLSYAQANDGSTSSLTSNSALSWDNNGYASTSKIGFVVVNNAQMGDGDSFQYMLYKSVDDSDEENYLQPDGEWKTYTKNGSGIEKIENVCKISWSQEGSYKRSIYMGILW